MEQVEAEFRDRLVDRKVSFMTVLRPRMFRPISAPSGDSAPVVDILGVVVEDVD